MPFGTRVLPMVGLLAALGPVGRYDYNGSPDRRHPTAGWLTGSR
jgi:hypothetical protein